MNPKPTIRERRATGLRPVVHATNGDELLVDPEDFFVLARFRWQPHGRRQSGAVYYATPLGSGFVYLGHLVLPRPEWAREEVQIHVNGDPRDARKANLAWVSHAVVSHRSDRPKRKGSSIYRGVMKVKNRFEAHISGPGGKERLGSFTEEVDAARAYNDAAVRLFGPYARLNEIPEKGR